MLMKNGIQDRCIQECLTSLAVARIQRVNLSPSLLSVGALVLVLHTWWFTRQSKTCIRHWALTKQKHAADINDCD